MAEIDDTKLHFVEVHGERFRYYENGTGEPLVLLSGGEYGTLYSLDAWGLNLGGLAQHFRVIALDKPGQGHSAIPPRDSDYTFEWLADRTERVLEAIGVGPAHMLGHSRGGSLVTWFARERPDAIRKAIIADSSTVAAEDPHFPSDIFYRNLADTPRAEVDAQAVSPAHISEEYVRRITEIAALPSRQEARRRMDDGVRANIWHPSLFAERERAIRHIDADGISVPTLVIWGFNDRSAPLYLGHRLFERISPKTSDAEFHVINQTGHYCFREQWQKFNRVVIDFCLNA